VLAALERELEGEPFLVIGVHSPKFPNERDVEMVRQAVMRYGVTHPVVVDPGRAIWDEWGINAWPTLAIVNADGQIVAAGAGEPDLDVLREAVQSLLDLGRREGTLDAKPLPLRPEPVEAGSLAYPGKVIVHGDRLWVADTGHDQVVEFSLDGVELSRHGGFTHPNGLAFVGETLYVADTGAGAIRTLEGTKVAADLRSPWDLAWDGELLYVAMAGSHQIWFHDPATAETGAFAGTGRELRIDGPIRTAAFAQPSGLALLDDSLYIADSEISSVRAIDDLRAFPKARTVCGSGELFGFGDRDGVGGDVLLQHPLGIAAGDGVLWIADSFNHKVKRVDPATGECRTVYGGLERLPLTSEPGFWEPEGLAYAEGKLYVADTNNHRIVRIDVETGERVTLVAAAGG
jgi:DNA-binding beta-propeller fold protein YncE